MTGNGLPVTWRLNFLTLTKCLPVSFGINETERELSELRTRSKGSSSFEDGRLRVPRINMSMRLLEIKYK